MKRDWNRNPPARDEIAPERLLVFEVVQDISSIADRLTDLGFLWVGDIERPLQPDKDHNYPKDPQKELPGRLLATVPTKDSLNKLLLAWRRYKRGEKATRGEGPVWTLFSALRDLRRWGPKDRVPMQTQDYLEEVLAESPDTAVGVEIELWSYPNAKRRSRAIKSVRLVVKESGGRVIGTPSDIPDAGYLGVLAEIPGHVAQSIKDQEDVRLVMVDDVQFIGPRAQVVSAPEDEDGELADEISPLPSSPVPVVPRERDLAPDPDLALLDGLPFTGHRLLNPFLIIHDPDDLSETINRAGGPELRRHGTAMASLIIHDDLGQPGQPVRRKLLVRPILVPKENAQGKWDEEIPEDALFPDLLHRAVRDLVEGRDGQEAVAPNLKVVSLSVGDVRRPFVGGLSAAARVIDWLSAQYDLLFIVSAGNWSSSITVADTVANVRTGAADIARALPQPINRTILSPAESTNAVTVGALHGDCSTGTPRGNHVIPVDAAHLPSPYSCVGLGFAEAVKPDLSIPGGRLVYGLNRFSPDPPTILVPRRSQDTHKVGQLVAAPGDRGQLDDRSFTAGTSNSTAIAARAASRILETLRELAQERGPDALPASHWPVLTKALLIHGSSWSREDDLYEHFKLIPAATGRGEANRCREMLARHIGHGPAEFERVIGCTAQRATLLGFGHLSHDQAAIFELPLPSDGWNIDCIRRIIATAAWFSPVFPSRATYRAIQMTFKWDDEPQGLGFKRTGATGGDGHHFNSRGTLIHENWEVDKHFSRRRKELPRTLRLRIQCRDAIGFVVRPVSFGLAVSFEVAVGKAGQSVESIEVYEQLRAAVAPRVQPRP